MMVGAPSVRNLGSIDSFSLRLGSSDMEIVLESGKNFTKEGKEFVRKVWNFRQNLSEKFGTSSRI